MNEHDSASSLACAACGCAVRVTAWGDPRSHVGSARFICHCGAPMEAGTGVGAGQRGAQDESFDPEDFLGEGSGVGGPGGGATDPSEPMGEGV